MLTLQHHRTKAEQYSKHFPSGNQSCSYNIYFNKYFYISKFCLKKSNVSKTPSIFSNLYRITHPSNGKSARVSEGILPYYLSAVNKLSMSCSGSRTENFILQVRKSIMFRYSSMLKPHDLATINFENFIFNLDVS